MCMLIHDGMYVVHPDFHSGGREIQGLRRPNGVVADMGSAVKILKGEARNRYGVGIAGVVYTPALLRAMVFRSYARPMIPVS